MALLLSAGFIFVASAFVSAVLWGWCSGSFEAVEAKSKAHHQAFRKR